MDVRFKFYNASGMPAWKLEQTENNFKKHYNKVFAKIEELLIQRGESGTKVEIKIDIDLKNGKVFPPIVQIGDAEADFDRYQDLKNEILALLPS